MKALFSPRMSGRFQSEDSNTDAGGYRQGRWNKLKTECEFCWASDGKGRPRLIDPWAAPRLWMKGTSRTSNLSAMKSARPRLSLPRCSL